MATIRERFLAMCGAEGDCGGRATSGMWSVSCVEMPLSCFYFYIVCFASLFHLLLVFIAAEAPLIEVGGLP